MSKALEMHFSEEPTGVAPLTKAERWLTSAALALYEEAQARHAENGIAAQAAYDRDIADRLEIQRERAEFERLESAPKRNQAAEDRQILLITRLETRRAANLQRDEENRKKFSSAFSLIQDFIRDELKGPTVDVEVTDAAIKGRSDLEMMDYRREQSQALQKQRDAVENAPIAPIEIIEASIRTAVTSRGREIGLNDVMRPRGPGGRPGLVHFPEIQSGGRLVLDVKGLVFDVFGDLIAARLIERARAKYDPAKALTAADRKAKLAELAEQIDIADRKATFWFRKLRDAGTAAPLPTSNMWAFLGIRPAAK